MQRVCRDVADFTNAVLTKVSSSPKSGAAFCAAKVVGTSSVKGGTSNSHLQQFCPQSATVVKIGGAFFIYNVNDGLMPIAVYKLYGLALYCSQILDGSTEFLQIQERDYISAIFRVAPARRIGHNIGGCGITLHDALVKRCFRSGLNQVEQVEQVSESFLSEREH